jgi:hypothetical protein
MQETMEEIESGVQTRVRKSCQSEDRMAGNLNWREFVHFTSQPVDGVPDRPASVRPTCDPPKRSENRESMEGRRGHRTFLA